MSDPVAIRVKKITKTYRIWREPSARLKSIGLHCVKTLVPALWDRCTKAQSKYFSDFYALRDVSFELRKGEAIGIVGKNGSGKSSLLQIIAGTLPPTAGEVEITGRLAALLELGSGFNPEFTGIENVFLNAAILGLTEAETRARLGDIAAFADIGEFIHQPVKTYSSGMMVRLAFAVQVAVEPDILIIDEALAVGDMFFQAKCYAYLEKLRRKGVTLLFVSHSLSAVRSICQRALLIEEGRCVLDGPVETVTDAYCERHLHPAGAPHANFSGRINEPISSRLQPPFEKRITHRTGAGRALYTECVVVQFGRETDSLVHGAPATISALVLVREDLPDESEVGILVRTQEGIDVFAVNSFFLRCPLPPQAAGTRLRLNFEFQVLLSPGTYNVALGFRSPVQGEYMDKIFTAAGFHVVAKDGGFLPGLVYLPGRIRVENVSS